jgi:polyferredoxin
MNNQGLQLLADLVLALHVGVVAFAVGGLLLVIVGNLRHWSWVNFLWLRIAHLLAIAIVVLEAWLGITCPLTSLEMHLRTQAGAASYDGGFIEHWLAQLLYFDAPLWAFTLAYSLFGLAVLAAWWRFPPQSRRRRKKSVAPD